MVKVKEHARGGTTVSAHSRMPANSMVGGEFLAPTASPVARHFILMARSLMYSDGLAGALHRAVAGGKYLSDGAVPFLSQLIVKLAHTARVPLSDADMHVVVVHLAGSLADLAEKMGRPSAVSDKRTQVHDIVEGVMAVLSGKVAAMARQAGAGQPGAPGPGTQPGPQPSPMMPQQGPPLLASAANG